MAYVAPSTVTAGDAVTAASYNVLTNDIIDHETLIGGARSAWTAWTPAFTQGVSVSLSANTSKYLKIGSLAIVRCNVTFSSTGTTANNIFCTLPAAIAHVTNQGYLECGSGDLYVSANTGRYGFLCKMNNSATQMSFKPTTTDIDYILGSAIFAGALVSGNQLSFTGMWEVAP